MLKFLKNKRKRRVVIIISIVIALVISGLFVFVSVGEIKDILGNVSSDETVIENDTSNYKLRDNATDYQRELFEELEQICESEEIDYEALAVSVSKNFVADFFTWSNKKSSYDVGGMCYINGEIAGNLYFKARDMFYNKLFSYMSGYSSEELPEVTLVTSEVEKYIDSYEFNGETYPCYLIINSWEYSSSSNSKLTNQLNTYDSLRIIINNGKAEIIEVYA